MQSLADRYTTPVQVSLPPGRFPDSAELTAYFVVAESITNAIKHADASEITVTGNLADGSLRIEIADDGKGGLLAAPDGDPRGLTGYRPGRPARPGPAGRGTLVVQVVLTTHYLRRPSASFLERLELPLASSPEVEARIDRRECSPDAAASTPPSSTCACRRPSPTRACAPRKSSPRVPRGGILLLSAYAETAYAERSRGQTNAALCSAAFTRALCDASNGSAGRVRG